MEKGKKGSPEDAKREANEQIDRSRIDREKQMEAVQDIVEPLGEGQTDAEADEPAEPETMAEPRQDRNKRSRGGRGRRDRVDEPAEETPQPPIEIEFDSSGFERISDDADAGDTGDMFKDAYMQEAIVHRVRAVEFDLEGTAAAEVGSLLAEVGGENNGFERIADEDDEAPAKGRGKSKAKAKDVVDDAGEEEKPAAKRKPAAKSPKKRAAAAKGKFSKSSAKAKGATGEDVLDDAEASVRDSGDNAEMAVRRGGRGRRRGGKPPSADGTDEPNENQEGADAPDGDAVEFVEAAEVRSEPIAEEREEREAEPETPSAPEGEQSADERPRGREPRGRGSRGGRGRGGDRTERTDRPERTESTDRPEQTESTDRPERTERADRPERTERTSRPERGDRPSGDRPQRDGRRPDRNDRGRDRGPQPTISDLLKEGQEILVQIAKEPIAKKGARITSHIAMPGRFLVYMPTIEHLGVSRKIESSSERARLRTLIQRIRQDDSIPSGGFIVRTAGIGISEEDLRNDALFLVRTWIDAKKDSEKKRSPAMVHQDLDLVQRLLRDQLSDDFTAIRVDSEEEYLRTVEFMNRMAPRMVNRVKLYTREEPILDAYGVQEEVDKALKPRVWLKSGGYLVINQTEALVAIDVNTGKFVGKGNARLEDTITRTNMEAVDEIARQIRLRDLGGIIVLDLIDMEDRRNRNKVSQALQEALASDRSPNKVLSFNDFGLIIMTRKRVKQSLERTMCAPCDYCEGAGWVKSPTTVCYEILVEARRLSKHLDDVRHTTLRIHPDVANALRNSEREVMEEIEAHLGNVDITSDKSIHQAQFDFAFV